MNAVSAERWFERSVRERLPRFCAACGSRLADETVGLERRTRSVCSSCGEVAYRNPKVLVCTIVAVGDRLLLCRRAEQPAAGSWALPGGFMEYGETLEEAAARETFEETGVRIDPQALLLHAVSTLPDIGEVYVGFLAVLPQQPALLCGLECGEVNFFAEREIPWSELAYPEIGEYLRVYFRELRSGSRVVHFGRYRASNVEVLSTYYHIGQIEHMRRALPARQSPDRSDS